MRFVLLGFASLLLSGITGCAFDGDPQGPKPGSHRTDPTPDPAPITQAPEAPAEPAPRLYIAGGDNAGRAEDTVWSADISADGSLSEWRDEMKLPAARTGHALVVTSTSLLVVGGHESSARAQREVFGAPLESTHVGAWHQIANLDLATASAAVTSNGSTLYVLGGEAENTTASYIQSGLYAPLSGGVPSTFADMAKLPSARARFAAANVGPYVFAVGGETETGKTTDVLVGRVSEKGTVHQWDAGASLPGARVDHALAASGDHLFVVGGESDAGKLDEVLVSAIRDDGTSREWRVTSRLPRGRSAHCVAVSGSYVYVIGGVSDEPLAEVLVAMANADGTMSDWKKVTTLPAPRAHAGCAVR
jgi:N-acetylneuraminic acid mutarotase